MTALETPDLFLCLLRSSLTHVRDSIIHIPSLPISSGHYIVRRDQFAAFLSTLGIQNSSSETSEVCSTKRPKDFECSVLGRTAVVYKKGKGNREMELKELNNLEKLISLHI